MSFYKKTPFLELLETPAIAYSRPSNNDHKILKQ